MATNLLSKYSEIEKFRYNKKGDAALTDDPRVTFKGYQAGNRPWRWCGQGLLRRAADAFHAVPIGYCIDRFLRKV